MVLAGILCAIGIVVPMFCRVKIRLDPMSFTLASHVAVFLGMFISPAVGVAVSSAQRLAFCRRLHHAGIVHCVRRPTCSRSLGADYLKRIRSSSTSVASIVFNLNAMLYGLPPVLIIITPFFKSGRDLFTAAGSQTACASVDSARLVLSARSFTR